MNDHIRDKPEERDTHVLVKKSFPPLAKNHERVKRENCCQAFNVIKLELFVKLFVKKLDSDLQNVLKFSRNHLMLPMNK